MTESGSGYVCEYNNKKQDIGFLCRDNFFLLCIEPDRSWRGRVGNGVGARAQGFTPDGVRQALAEYVDFSGTPGVIAASATGAPSSTNAAASAASALGTMRKGLLMADVEALLGPATTASETKEGTLLVLVRTYQKDGMKISTRFVNDVLIDFSITPQ